MANRDVFTAVARSVAGRVARQNLEHERTRSGDVEEVWEVVVQDRDNSVSVVDIVAGKQLTTFETGKNLTASDGPIESKNALAL